MPCAKPQAHPHSCLYCSGQQLTQKVEIYMQMCLWLCLLCVNVRAFFCSIRIFIIITTITSGQKQKQVFIIIFDSTLRPMRTIGDHTGPSCPQNNQNCLKHHCHMNIYFIFNRMSMSLSVNQAEAPSHIKVVCFGHGAPQQADSTSPQQSFLRTVGASFVLAFPRALACLNR